MHATMPYLLHAGSTFNYVVSPQCNYINTLEELCQASIVKIFTLVPKGLYSQRNANPPQHWSIEGMHVSAAKDTAPTWIAEVSGDVSTAGLPLS